MFNASFNLTSFVQDIPSLPLRQYTLLSLIGSVNYTIFRAADDIVAQLQADGVTHDELRELDRREIIAMVTGPDTGPSVDSIDSVRMLYKLREEWQPILTACASMIPRKEVTPKERLGSMVATIKMLTGPQRARVDVNAATLLKAVGIDVSEDDIKLAALKSKASADAFAQIRAARVGMTEYIIDQVFAHVLSEDEDDEVFAQLDDNVKEHLCSKCLTAFNKAFEQAKQNVLTGRKGDDVLGISDMVILQSLIGQFTAATTREETRRAPAPKQSKKITTEVNGIPFTKVVEA